MKSLYSILNSDVLIDHSDPRVNRHILPIPHPVLDDSEIKRSQKTSRVKIEFSLREDSKSFLHHYIKITLLGKKPRSIEIDITDSHDATQILYELLYNKNHFTQENYNLLGHSLLVMCLIDNKLSFSPSEYAFLYAVARFKYSVEYEAVIGHIEKPRV